MSEEKLKRYAQESRQRGIVGLKTAAFFAVIAAAVYFLWGPQPSKIFWVPAVFFLAVAALELLNWRYCLRRSREPAEEEAEEEFGPPSEEFELVERDGDVWLERRIAYEGGGVAVLLSDDPEIAARSIPHANAIIADLPAFLAGLETFKAAEKERLPELAAEIEGLKLASIEFFGKKHSDTAEVMFEEAPSGRLWGCAYRNGVFYNLSFEG